MTPSRTCSILISPIRFERSQLISSGSLGPYVELGVTLGALVQASLLDLGGAVEAARGSAKEGLAGEGPAGGHSSN